MWLNKILKTLGCPIPDLIDVSKHSEEQYVPFSHCLKLAKISSLKQRRADILAKFSKNALTNPKYKKKSFSVPLRSPIKDRAGQAASEAGPMPNKTVILALPDPCQYPAPILAPAPVLQAPQPGLTLLILPGLYCCYDKNLVLIVLTAWWLIIVCGYFVIANCCNHSDMSLQLLPSTSTYIEIQR